MDERIDKIFREHVEQFDKLPEDTNWSTNKGWEDYQNVYTKTSGGKKKTLVILGSVAAAVVIVFMVGFMLTRLTFQPVIVRNDNQEIKEITLPDGNTIWLNKNSSVEYPSILDSRHNKIKVNGEVYFEIQHLTISEYIIQGHNALAIIENPGSFNIQAFSTDENVNITVSKGAIKVVEESYTEGMALIVAEGNYCSVHKSQKLVYSSVNKNNNYLAWKTGKLVFDKQPIAKVTDILAKYYQAEIEIEDREIAYCLFSGAFEKQPIDTILNQIKTDLNLVIKQTGSKITFSGKGC